MCVQTILVALPSLSVQASAHQHVAKELKKDAALTECVAEILKQPAAVREEFLEQWRQWQWQSVMQCSGFLTGGSRGGSRMRARQAACRGRFDRASL
jgi:hypothetical protein